MKKIAIASDHGGFELKESIITFLLKKGNEIKYVVINGFLIDLANYKETSQKVKNAMIYR